MLTYGLGADAGRTAVSRMTPPSTLLSAPTTARAGQFVISSKNEFGPATRFAIQFRWSHSVLPGCTVEPGFEPNLWRREDNGD